MINLPRPDLETGKPLIVSVPASKRLKAFIQTLVKRAEKLKTSKVDPHVDNMLMVTTDGRKAALDIRLVMPSAKRDVLTKVDKLVENVYQIWDDTSKDRLTQMIFLDLSTPSKSFNVYDEIREMLEVMGIPSHEIAYMHDAETDEEKMALFTAMNTGKIRVLIGSTEKMGAGTNAQKRLYAMHHFDF